ncbi:MAG: NfeD family protein [Phycisphaerales bacterium]
MDSMLYWGLALLGLALLLTIIEVFVPTAGVLAVTALVVAISAVVCLFRYSAAWGMIGSLIVIVGGPAAFVIGLRIMPNTPLGRKLVLNTPRADGSSGDDGSPAPAAAANALAALVGKQGTVASDLRPIGSVTIDGRRYDAISESGMVRAGTAVRVWSVEGSELRVRTVE